MYLEKRPIKKIITKEEYDKAVGEYTDENDLTSMLQRAFSGYRKTLNMLKSPLGLLSKADWLCKSEHDEKDYYYWKEDGYEDIAICGIKEYQKFFGIDGG